MKVRKSAAKRIKVSGGGKILRYKSGKAHLLGKKPSRRKRALSGKTTVPGTVEKQIRRLIGK